MSKFTDAHFGGYEYGYAVSKEKYSKEQAVEMAKIEMGFPYATEPYAIRISDAYVRWRAGVNDDYEPCVGWWLEYTEKSKRSVPVWYFTLIRNGDVRLPEYEYIEMEVAELDGLKDG